jgi:hypothetical protein
MKTQTLTLLLQIAGLLHVGLLCAGASMTHVVEMRTHLNTLPVFLRRLFVVYLAFIGLVLTGFGILTFVFAKDLAAGNGPALGVCGLMLAFWLFRLGVAVFVFDVKPYLKTWYYHLGYQATNLVFLYFVAVYAFTFWHGFHA